MRNKTEKIDKDKESEVKIEYHSLIISKMGAEVLYKREHFKKNLNLLCRYWAFSKGLHCVKCGTFLDYSSMKKIRYILNNVWIVPLILQNGKSMCKIYGEENKIYIRQMYECLPIFI